ncbi:MAG TPA: potassium transporter TrkG [Gammaproteobacteria bacterium]
MLPPVLIELYFQDGDVWPFLDALLLAGGIGLTGIGLTRQHKAQLRHRDGFLVLMVFWILVSAVSALPFILSPNLQLSYTDAVFEAISGITTTGASILADIDNAPHSILYYRAQLNFLGGLGVIVLAVALLPMIGVGGAKLYQSEVSGLAKDERITPRLEDTARRIWFIYALLAAGCTLAYYLAGMNWFAALCHSFSTVSLGGFSTHSASLAHYDSASIELVGGVFSILAAVNFTLYFIAGRRLSLKPLFQNPELRFFLAVVAGTVAFTCGYLYLTKMFPPQEALYHGFFQAVSIMTDNGLTTVDYPNWPLPVALVLILSSFFGGCVGSTCGGIKAMRFLMLYKQYLLHLDQILHPRGVFTLKLGGRVVDTSIMQSVWAFFYTYVFFSVAFIIGLVLTGEDLPTAIGTTAACLNNMGVGYAGTASGFGGLTEPGKWLMCLAMLFGRLELFPILVIFSSKYRRL